MGYKVNERWISSGDSGQDRVYWETEVRGSSVNDAICISTRYIGTDHDGIPARDSDSVTITAGDVSRFASIFKTLDEKINGSKATSFKDCCEEIISDELGRHASKFPGNLNIICALRLMDFGRKNDFNKTIELAHFIEQSWTDLELTEEQKKKIILKLVELLKMDDGFEEEDMKNENTVKSLREFVEKKIADNKADLAKYKGMDQMAFIYDNVGDKIGKLEGENIAYEEVLKKIILIW